MLRTLALLSSLGLALGCVVVADDDDTANDTGPNDSPGDDNVDTLGDDNTDPADDGNETPATDDATDTPADSGGSETGTVSLCGWGPVMEKKITEGYICGGDGVDPMGTYPQACPDIELAVGDVCGDIEGQGCCAGDVVWFCSSPNDGSPNTLQMQDCAAG